MPNTEFSQNSEKYHRKVSFFIYDKARGKVKIDFPLKIIFAEKEMDSSPTPDFLPPIPSVLHFGPSP